jgi:two-component system, cell cycle sensor histidine kinase PleC
LPREAANELPRPDEFTGLSALPLDSIVAHESSASDEAGATGRVVRLADGRWLRFSERPTNDGGCVSIGADITTLKQHEERLLDSERRLTANVADLRRARRTLEAQAAQMKDLLSRYREQKAKAESANHAKSLFLANMSHELRTPLNHIIGFAELMESQAFGELGCVRYVGYCADIRASGRSLLDMINGVLEMSELETGAATLSTSAVSLHHVLQTTRDAEMELAAERKIEVVVEGTDDDAIRADAAALSSSLARLLRNAIQFSPEGGRVRLRARRLGDNVDFFVQDSGDGIPAEALERLGRPFEQFNARLANGMKGAGLGLAIARARIELQGGSLSFRSRVGRGTVARARIPAGRVA